MKFQFKRLLILSKLKPPKLNKRGSTTAKPCGIFLPIQKTPKTQFGPKHQITNYTKTTTTYPGTQLFVYGQEVDDFIFVKKEAIWTVATSALQEVDRQLQDTKAQLAPVLARLDALENA